MSDPPSNAQIGMAYLAKNYERQKRNARAALFKALRAKGVPEESLTEWADVLQGVRRGTVLAAEQKLEFTGDDLDIRGIECCELCGDVWKYEFACPVCLGYFVEAVGLYEPRWLPFQDDDDKFECRVCDAHFEKTVPGAYRMDTTWRLICLDG